MRDRTADLLRAKQALSQLSYSPISESRTSLPIVLFYADGRGTAVVWRVISQRSIRGEGLTRPEVD